MRQVFSRPSPVFGDIYNFMSPFPHNFNDMNYSRNCKEMPMKPSSPILCKLEQKLSFMTSVSDMPYLRRDIMSFRSRHRLL